jgi:hypothetical protein
MHYELFGQFKKTLRQLDAWLDAGVAFAKETSFDPNVFLDLRLAPDQFPFVKQVQIACDTAKLGSARLAGKDPPSHADTEKTIDELHARVKSVIAYLDTFTPADFANVGSRTLTLPRWEGKSMTAGDYFLEHVLPNFYFHTTHVYAILRHNGVNLGKRDFLGPLSLK